MQSRRLWDNLFLLFTFYCNVAYKTVSSAGATVKTLSSISKPVWMTAVTDFLTAFSMTSRFSTSARRAALVASLGLSFTLWGCQVTPDHRIEAEKTSPTTPLATAQSGAKQVIAMVVGKYASSDYHKRAEGYDWVTVDILADKNVDSSAEKIRVHVQSRSDIKNPTCSYQGTASFVGQDAVHGAIFQHTLADNSLVFYQIKDGVLTIGSDSKTALSYYCSGGATLAGEYRKV